MDKIAILLRKIDYFDQISKIGNVLGPYTRPDGRKIVVIRDSGKSRTMSYPKYLYQQHHKIEIGPNDTIDHIDRNKCNNDISNLRLVKRDQHSADDTRRVRLVKLTCQICNKEFERSPRLIRDKSKKGKVSQFCSRQCAGKYSREVQLGLRKKLPVQLPPVSEYYRNEKNIESFANYILKKYAIDL